MKSWKVKVFVPIFLVTALFIAKLVMWDFAVSTGKRVGNLTKISKKGKIFKTWEGTIDEGSGDKLTSFFSVRDEKIAKELYGYEGRKVVIYYEEYLANWPWETKYNVTSWKKNEEDKVVNGSGGGGAGGSITSDVLDHLSQTLFCSMLGTLYKDKELYDKVKNHMKENNLYIYNQYEKCNE
jgi:heme-degrading monooxygenase HmoA